MHYRLFVITLLLVTDGYIYVTSKSESTSYAAHAGGLLVGLLAGAITLKNLEVTWLERRVLVPGAWALTFVVVVAGIGVFGSTFPPSSLFRDVHASYEPCCWHLLRCGDAYVDREDYGEFRCKSTFDTAEMAWTYSVKHGNQVMENSCSAFAGALS